MANHTQYIIGVDGGGTSTVARLADLQGNVLSVATAGPSNLQTYGPEQCAQTLHDAISEVCSSAHVGLSDIAVVVYGTAGAGRKADQERLFSAIQQVWKPLPQKPSGLHIVGDADIALEAAFGGEPGIIIIAGTGSIIYGRDVDGTIKRAGGWGPILGDPGSGTALGLSALRIAMKTFDGCIESSHLVRLIAETEGIDSPETLIRRVYKEKFPPSKLAPVVLHAAKENDLYAKQIVQETARDLVDMLRCGIKKFSFIDSVPISYVGGLLQSDTIYPEIVKQEINTKIPNADIRQPKFKPEEGAIAMARRIAETGIAT